jgi:hypothetical protein
MTKEFTFDFTVNVPFPLKRKEIDEMITIMDEYVKTKGKYNIELKKYLYEDYRSVESGLLLFLGFGFTSRSTHT